MRSALAQDEASAIRSRSGRERVAILLLALGESLGSKVLQRFDAGDIKTIMSSASALGQVGKQDLEHIVDDFAAEFAQALGLGTDFDAVRNLIEQAFSPQQLSDMLGGAIEKPDEPAWGKLGPGMEQTLVPYLLDEHPQTIAFVLSRIDEDFASRCLSILPGDFRVTVAQRLLKMQPVKPESETVVSNVLKRDLLAKSASGLESESRSRLANMLNKLDREQSAEIISGLALWQADEAAKLKRMLFSFEDIAKLAQPARLALFDKLQTEQVIAALRGMPDAIKEVCLSSLGARARRMVEAELSSDKGARTKEGDAARAAIASTVLAMAARGELELPAADASEE